MVGQLSDKNNRYVLTKNMYTKRFYKACSEEELLKLIQGEVDAEINTISPLWIDLFYYFLKSEPESLFNRDIQELVYKKLVDMYNSRSDEFIMGVLSGLRYLFQGVRSYLEIADIIREIEPIDQLPEIKTRLYRIPIYTQILESILSNLFKSLRDIISTVKGTDYANQMNLGNLKDILSSSGFSDLFKFVDIDVRNAINHGGIIINPWDTLFIYTSGNVKQEKVWTVKDPIGEAVSTLIGARKPHFNDFIEGAFDNAGGIIVGFLRFFSRHPEIILKNIEGIKADEYLSTEYLCRFLSFPGCMCTNIDTGLVGPSSQLNIHFFVSESDHDRLALHSLEVAIITSEWISNYQRYLVGYRHLRMVPGTIRFRKKELEGILNGQILPKDVMKNVISRGDFVLLFKASDENIDLEVVRNYRYPLINGVSWKLREIEDVSSEEYKRFRANLYIQNGKNKCDVTNAVKTAKDNLKSVKNPPSPSMKIKHGNMVADAIYLYVFKKRSRRKDRVISLNNPNFICLIEWHTKNCPALKKGGISETTWDRLKTEKFGDILFAWNPNFYS